MRCDGVLPPYIPALKDGNELMEGYFSIRLRQDFAYGIKQ